MKYLRALGALSLVAVGVASCGDDGVESRPRGAGGSAEDGGEPIAAGRAPDTGGRGGELSNAGDGTAAESPSAGADAGAQGGADAGAQGGADAGAQGGADAGAQGGAALGGVGGASTPVALPLIGEHPRDRTVVEGLPAAFRITASGSALTYAWERSNNHGQDWIDAGSTGELYTVPAAQLAVVSLGGDDGAQFRVSVTNPAGTVTSTSATLHVLSLAASARVFAQHPGGPTVWEHDVANAMGAGYMTTADLAAGTFAARSGDGASQLYAYAGLHTIRFINHYPGPVTIAAGNVRLAYSGSYSHSSNAELATAQSTAVLSAVVSPASSFDRWARLTHQTQQDGSSTTRVEDHMGGMVVIHEESSTSLSAELVLPELIIPSGQSLSISCALQTSSVNGVSDFSTPAQLSLELPPGVSLDSNSAVPLAWVTN
jgi:hypothetical protein